MLKDKRCLGFTLILFGTALLSLLVGTTSAPATTLSSGGNSVSVGASDVGVAFKGSNSIGAGLPKSTANSIWTVLGIGANNLSLQALKNSTSGATDIFSSDGVGTVFKNISADKGLQQTILGVLKGLCVSSSSCSGGSFQNGLHASTILAAAFGSDPKATLKSFFHIKFQTPGRTHLIGDVGVVPLPATLPLLAAAIGALAIIGRRWRPK